MADVTSFDAVSERDARVLILGTMPGVASLQAQRYYAHPRNAFWPIMAELCGVPLSSPYELRLSSMCRAGVALWDVLRRCVRPGSLDSDIEPASVEANDFDAFFGRHQGVRAVCCNGGEAYRLFMRRVRPTLRAPFDELPLTQLPSTSPAHASRSFEQKRAAWRAALLPHVRPPRS